METFNTYIQRRLAEAAFPPGMVQELVDEIIQAAAGGTEAAVKAYHDGMRRVGRQYDLETQEIGQIEQAVRNALETKLPQVWRLIQPATHSYQRKNWYDD